MVPQIELENIEMKDEEEPQKEKVEKQEEQKQIQIGQAAKRDFSSLQKFEDDSPK